MKCEEVRVGFCIFLTRIIHHLLLKMSANGGYSDRVAVGSPNLFG